MTRLEATGLRSVKLQTQYRISSDISEHPKKHVYTGDRCLRDGENVDNRHWQMSLKRWAGNYIGRLSARTTIVVSISNGRCLTVRGGHSKVKFENLTVLMDIILSLLDSKVPPAAITVICFYFESIRRLKDMLGILDAGIADELKRNVFTVDESQAKENVVVLIEMAKDGDEVCLVIAAS